MTDPSAPVGLRPATDADRPFLQRVYDSTRTAEIALAGWDETMARVFLDSQFRAQDAGYRATYPDADRYVLTLEDEDIGRMIVASRPEVVHVVDLALLPEHRGQGVGTAVLQALLDEAGPRPVRLSVMQDNPAIALYRRLGFRPTGSDGPYITMERPDGAGGSGKPALV